MKNFLTKLTLMSSVLSFAFISNGGFERGNILIDVTEEFSIGDRDLAPGMEIEARLSEHKAGNQYYLLEDLAGNKERIQRNRVLMHQDINRGGYLSDDLQVEIDDKDVVDVFVDTRTTLRGGCETPVEVTHTKYAIAGRIEAQGKTVAEFSGSTMSVQTKTLRSDCAGR